MPWVSGKRAEKKHSWEISLKCGVVLLRIDALGKKASCYLERIQLLDQRRLEGWLRLVVGEDDVVWLISQLLSKNRLPGLLKGLVWVINLQGWDRVGAEWVTLQHQNYGD